VRESIREAALCLFDISDVSKVNIFFELGIAVGMQRSLALLARAPYTAPSDLQGLRRIEYGHIRELEFPLQSLLSSRLQELQRPPNHGQEFIHQKMQIDANWRYRLSTASKSIYFFAGDLSWASDYQDAIERACERGVTIQICCREPRKGETRKWQNIEILAHLPDLQIRLFAPDADPGLRGFITDAEEISENTEVMLIEKQTRLLRSQNYASTGLTIGETSFLYKAYFYRGHTHRKHVTAMIRLFEALWNNSRPKGA
jgi:hypothetical protein